MPQPARSLAPKKPAVQPKAAAPIAGPMTIAKRLHQIRKEVFEVSQEGMGEFGFVSGPGWIKLENGQRSPSEELIENLCAALTTQRDYTCAKADALLAELLCLKYLSDSSGYVRALAYDRWRQSHQVPASAPAPMKGGKAK